jgi:hypothetical protein
MHTRKQVFSILLMALYLAVMDISVQSQIAAPAIASDRASRLDSLSNKPVQAGAGCVRDGVQTDAPNA